jgi:hypothetical protein
MDRGVLLQNDLPVEISVATFRATQRKGVADDHCRSDEQYGSALPATMSLSDPSEFNPPIVEHKVRER